MKKKPKIPKIKNEDAERDFWSRVKLDDYFEPNDFAPVSFPNLKPSSQPISIRLPSPLLFRIEVLLKFFFCKAYHLVCHGQYRLG